MFVKVTTSGPRRYVQLVESYRDDAGPVKKRTVAGVVIRLIAAVTVQDRERRDYGRLIRNAAIQWTIGLAVGGASLPDKVKVTRNCACGPVVCYGQALAVHNIEKPTVDIWT